LRVSCATAPASAVPKGQRGQARDLGQGHGRRGIPAYDDEGRAPRRRHAQDLARGNARHDQLFDPVPALPLRLGQRVRLPARLAHVVAPSTTWWRINRAPFTRATTQAYATVLGDDGERSTAHTTASPRAETDAAGSGRRGQW
jgi:hypothetical protein